MAEIGDWNDISDERSKQATILLNTNIDCMHSLTADHSLDERGSPIFFQSNEYRSLHPFHMRNVSVFYKSAKRIAFLRFYFSAWLIDEEFDVSCDLRLPFVTVFEKFILIVE